MNRDLLTNVLGQGSCILEARFDDTRFIDDDLVDEGVPRFRLREAFADAVEAVVAGAAQLAEAHAAQAARVERVRRARLALMPGDRSHGMTGGVAGAVAAGVAGGWSPDVVADREVVTELAAALHLNEADARRLVETSRGLCGTFADTGELLERGAISYRHAEKVVMRGLGLADELVADYQARLLPIAERVSVQRLEREARAAVVLAQPTTAVQRHVDAAARRRLDLDPAADGMAYLTHYLPAVEAVAIYNRATDLAKSLKGGGDPRTLTQLRVDTLSDLLLNGEPSIPGASRTIRPRVHVTVPVLTLLDSGASGAAELEGYGPVDRLTALELARDAPSLVRVLTDPISGCTLNYGRQRYKPPADLDELVRLAHAECTFPISCTDSATADLDHTIPWSEGGETAFHNLSPLCSTHHKVKHHTEWKVENDPGGSGVITWTSPAGFAYRVDPTPPARPAARAAPRFG